MVMQQHENRETRNYNGSILHCSRSVYVCVMVDVDHRFLDFVISHPPPQEKKLNSFKCFAYHKNIYILRPREQQPKKDMLGRQVSLLLRTPPYLFDLQGTFQIGIQQWNVGAAVTWRALCRFVAPCALCSRDNGAWERESRYDTEKILAPNAFVSFVRFCCCCCFVSFFFSLSFSLV